VPSPDQDDSVVHQDDGTDTDDGPVGIRA